MWSVDHIVHFARPVTVKAVLGGIAIEDSDIHAIIVIQETRKQNGERRFAYPSFLVGEGNYDGIAHLGLVCFG